LIGSAKGLGNENEARAAQHELDELAANDPEKAALDERLAAVIRGEAPQNNPERLQLADRAYEKRLYAASTRLYGEALAADPKLADDRQAQHRYNAACAAALAAAETGTPPPLTPPSQGGETKEEEARLMAADSPRSDTERAKLRSQARTWLEAELAAWTNLLASANAQSRQSIAETLKHWQQDADLAGVRDETALAKLPALEQEEWKALWGRINGLLNKASRP
jgi:hypothetical protein